MDAATLLLIAAALLGSAAAVLHMVGWIPPKYRKTLAELQASTARSISDALYGPLVALDSTLKAMDVSKGIQGLQDTQTKFMGLADNIQSSLTKLSVFPDTIADGFLGFAAALDRLGGQGNQPPSVDARLSKKAEVELSSFAKVGAKKLALAAAGGFHPAAGIGLGIANAMGIVDDGMLEKIAEFLIDNPEAMARLNAAGQKIQAGRGLGDGGTSSVSRLPGI